MNAKKECTTFEDTQVGEKNYLLCFEYVKDHVNSFELSSSRKVISIKESKQPYKKFGYTFWISGKGRENSDKLFICCGVYTIVAEGVEMVEKKETQTLFQQCFPQNRSAT